MTFLSNARLFLEDQRKLVSDYWGLDYWNKHSLSEGFNEAFDVASEYISSELADKNPVLKGAAGGLMAAAKLFGSIPIGLAQWELDIIRSIPKGLPHLVYNIAGKPVEGFFYGGLFVCSRVDGWIHGSLASGSAYDAAFNITETLGTAALLLMGARGMAKGGSGMYKSFKRIPSGFIPLNTPAFAAAAAQSTAIAVDLAKFGSSANQFASGIMLMAAESGPTAAGPPSSSGGTPKPKEGPPSSRRPKTQDEGLIADALDQSGGHRANAAKRLREMGYEISAGTISRRIDSAKTERLVAWRGHRVKVGSKRISDKDLARVLRTTKGNRNLAARKLGERGIHLLDTAISGRIGRSKEDSPLYPYREKKAKGPIGKIGVTVPHKVLLEALQRTNGNRTKAAGILSERRYEITSSAISDFINKTPKGSPFRAFVKTRRSVRGLTDDDLAGLLRMTKGDRVHAARISKKIMGRPLSHYQLDARVKKAGSDSPLAPFKELKGKGGSPKKISDRKMAVALKKHDGNRRATARTLGISYSTITVRLAQTNAGPLAVFKNKTWKNSPTRFKKVDDKTLSKYLEMAGGKVSLARLLLKADTGISIQGDAIFARVDRNPSAFPNIKRRPMSGRHYSIPDAEIVAQLEKFSGDRTKTAAALRKRLGISITKGTISKYIDDADPESALGRFQDIKGRATRPKKVSDEELYSLLKDAGGNRTEVVRHLEKKGTNYSLSAISRRIDEDATKGGPLSEFKNMRGRSGTRPKYSDKELALQLEAHDGDLQEAARNLSKKGKHIFPFEIRRQIRRASFQSPLHRWNTKLLRQQAED